MSKKGDCDMNFSIDIFFFVVVVVVFRIVLFCKMSSIKLFPVCHVVAVLACTYQNVISC